MIRRLIKKAVHRLERAQLAGPGFRTRASVTLVTRTYLLDHALTPSPPLRLATSLGLSA